MRRDDTALIGPAIVDHVEGGRGAEIDHDQVARMACVRGDHVHRTVRPDILRLVDVEGDAPFDRRAPGDQRVDAEIFRCQHLQVVERAGHHGGDDNGLDILAVMAFQLEQLVQPDGILIGGATRVGGDPPARLDRVTLDQREDDIGIPCVDRKQHAGRIPCSVARYSRKTSPACTRWTCPSAARNRSAPSGASPS